MRIVPASELTDRALYDLYILKMHKGLRHAKSYEKLIKIIRKYKLVNIGYFSEFLTKKEIINVHRELSDI